MESLEKQKFIFANFFLIANKLQVKGDAYLREITTKQWFLIMMISQFDYPPMLTEVANIMGTSRQNIKQLALKLQDNGFLTLEKDGRDNRTLRLVLTKKNKNFWAERQREDIRFITDIFKKLSNQELDIMVNAFHKIVEELKS